METSIDKHFEIIVHHSGTCIAIELWYIMIDDEHVLAATTSIPSDKDLFPVKVMLDARLIPLSQVDQYLGLAGQIQNGAGFEFFGS